MSRLTHKQVCALADRVSDSLGTLPEKGEGYYSRPGRIVIYSAYGAYAVNRVENTGGGQSTLLGLSTLRECYVFLRGMSA